MAENLSIQRLSGDDLDACLPDLARLRIQVFREYPYLYEGSVDYEEKYLKIYAAALDGVMVVVRDGGQVVGASSGLPMEVETPEAIAPFVAHGYDPRRIFYYGESVLLPKYRGQGLGNRFFAEREAHVRARGRFGLACFCAIERPANHPHRPADYVPLDAFWNRRGFVKHPELRTTYSYRELGEDAETPKPMVFWLKHLV